MARPKAYDPERVLESAMQAFWSKGYLATSASDLVDSTGLGRGSLYNAYTGKKDLFHHTLRCYNDVWAARQEEFLAGGAAVRDRIRGLLMTVVDEECAEDGPRGCFAVNTALELADQDPEVRALVAAVFDRMAAALTNAVREGRASGELAGDDEPEAVALYVLNSMYGLRVLGKTMPRESLVGVVEMTLRAL
ncbi:TetR/AcrR family transcriptional repressor of nem operon [Actinokineospora baliensis]|uniref:TetR/AcrR family transcriptional regulator n=1 Tax=Actinokineospora baliensis TaxID=547056 RepID=UPI00195D67E3|nr:TetR/AcrR family transcriptional regulator [Actinokineospora baliensis]MBM7775020.1 TetR/AcrR family transcriptional repressor of nem operon [Actinokineospora baliensis]